jgi:cytochrome c
MTYLARSVLLLLSAGWLALIAGCRSKASEAVRPERRAVAASSAAHSSVSPTSPKPEPTFEPGDAARGKALVAQYECNRCHEGTGHAAPKLDQDCVRCHEQIATGKFGANKAKLSEWQAHVAPYRDVPSLNELGARVRPAWIRDYLLKPHDLRPNLAQTMPRLKLSPEQARDIATYLVAGAPAPSTITVSAEPAHVARGRALMTERGCVGCHQMTGAGLSAPPRVEPAPRTLGLAPDLRFARERAEPAVLARWLLDPTRVKHDAVMPNLALSVADASDLAAFLSFSVLEPAIASELPTRLPLLTRRVGYDEVNQRVFAVTCRHCHTNPDLAGGDGGPGNTGGFGFAPRKIDFSSYQGIQSGGVDAQGNRVSLFAKTSEGVPRLVAALMQRAREERGGASDEVRGMPLGLPALTPEQIQLVESWVEQGRPL